MKFRQSGMPEEAMWKTFFNPEDILRDMEVDSSIDMLMDIGCGYGTFLIPAAKLINKKVIGIDIDDNLLLTCKNYIRDFNLNNIELLLWDISAANNSEILQHYTESMDYICLFNMLHCEEPMNLLMKAKSMLKMGGRIGVIHWRYEDTPRGPSMDIRPTPAGITQWAKDIGLRLVKQVDLPPYHYGLVFAKL